MQISFVLKCLKCFKTAIDYLNLCQLLKKWTKFDVKLPFSFPLEFFDKACCITERCLIKCCNLWVVLVSGQCCQCIQYCNVACILHIIYQFLFSQCLKVDVNSKTKKIYCSSTLFNHRAIGSLNIVWLILKLLLAVPPDIWKAFS